LFESLIQLDKQVLIFINNLGTEQWDPFWLAVTNQFSWIPLFALILFLILKNFGWKRGGVMILFLIALVAISDQFTVFVKDNSYRLRPINDPEIAHLLRVLVKPQSFSFMSGHATTSTFFSVFVIFLLKEKYKKIYLILIFPFLFAFSRLYLAVHFPLDVISGILTGLIFANIYYFFFKKVDEKLFF
jgi:undecaprenyl-diphosphatase